MRWVIRALLSFGLGIAMITLLIVAREMRDQDEKVLGEPDLMAFCLARYGARSSISFEIAGSPRWQCAPTGPSDDAVTIDPIAVCVQQFGAGAVARRRGDALAVTWECVRD